MSGPQGTPPSVRCPNRADALDDDGRGQWPDRQNLLASCALSQLLFSGSLLESSELKFHRSWVWLRAAPLQQALVQSGAALDAQAYPSGGRAEASHRTGHL